MTIILELLAVLASGLFAGAALFVHFVEHPARLELGPALGIPAFNAMYRRAAKMMPLLALTSFGSAVIAWLWNASAWWLLNSLLMGALFPYTYFKIMPLNRELSNPELDRDSPLAVAILQRWGELHKYRAFMSLAAFAIFLLLLKWDS